MFPYRCVPPLASFHPPNSIVRPGGREGPPPGGAPKIIKNWLETAPSSIKSRANLTAGFLNHTYFLSRGLARCVAHLAFSNLCCYPGDGIYIISFLIVFYLDIGAVSMSPPPVDFPPPYLNCPSGRPGGTPPGGGP